MSVACKFLCEVGDCYMGEYRQGKLWGWLLAGQWRAGLQACLTRLGDSGSFRNWGELIDGLEDGWKMAERFWKESSRER